MVIGGKTQYLTRVQGMPRQIEERQTMCLPLNQGGKQILDIQSRNEAIDLWNLKEFLRQGDERANWPFFAEHTIIKRWEASQPVGSHGSMYNVFLQAIHIPSWRIDPLPDDIRCMIHAAKKFQLRFTALSVSKDIQLQMPIWSHLNVYGKITKRDSWPTS
ncbi:hypothetical protein B0H11DRAFT_1974642 [Mycena galericulata]|nr:hypothetical protein B0H11DRAFT_1974642 [Mycena galericulata]